MHNEGDEVHVSEQEVSAGSKEGVGRWVLAIGTLLAILLLSIVWIIPAMTQGDVEEEATMSGTISSQNDGEEIDSIIEDEAVVDDADQVDVDPIAEPAP
ncbi:hypothetical protein [Qipengyuania atrilutea]|uniref:Uncharacterized protein n=1 Tax=Qipengyuania atrilutea TaxID=2744473 RepID=A0A850HEW6_9SPHN|nr:hypothetical protein [Actirhodobacter atriluteus]NVD45809.1 hypothetical protein [Actirhodobacter atriluteus]